MTDKKKEKENDAEVEAETGDENAEDDNGVVDSEVLQLLALKDRKLQHVTSSEAGPPIWLISFTDVMALMLTFFVLLYSMSSPDVEKFEYKVGLSAHSKAEFGEGDKKGGDDEGDNIGRMDFSLAEDLQYIEAILAEIIQERKIGDQLKLQGRDDLLMIYIRSDIKLSDRDFLLFLNGLEPVLEGVNNRLELVGSQNAKGVFDDLQALGRILQDYGYTDPLSITVRDLSGSGKMKSRMAIAIRSTDGRRIVR